MCGRFVRKGEPKQVAEFLGIRDGEENWTESFNVAPLSAHLLDGFLLRVGERPLL